MAKKGINQVLERNTISYLDGSKAYQKLRERVTEEGILDRDYLYYVFHISISLAGFSFCLYKLFTAVSVPHTIIWSMLFALFSVQVAGGNVHEGGHRAIFKSTFWNDVIGYIASAPFGMGYSYWKVKHNQHHAHPNEEGEDPDVELPILSFTKERYNAKKGLANILKRYQVWLYYPIGLLVFISLRTQSLKFYVKSFTPKLVPEIMLFFAGNIVWFGFPFYFFALPKAFLSVLAINLTTGFYLFNIFAPNHKGMPYIKKGTRMSFLEQQVITSRNLSASWLWDYIYLGLNYQIEHHLFPNCPRNKLKLVTPHLLKICKELKLEYTVVSPLRQNQIILGELHKIASSK